MMVIEKRDRVSTPQRTFIDLSQDNEDEDPTYTPRSVKRPPVSPHKTNSPRRRKLSDSAQHYQLTPGQASIWRDRNQMTLNSFVKSPAKKHKHQATMHSFFGPNTNTPPPPPPLPDARARPSKWTRLDAPVQGSAAPLPASFRYETPEGDADRQLASEMASAMLQSTQEIPKRGVRPNQPVFSIPRTPTPPGSSNHHKSFDIEVVEESLFFSGGSQATTVNTTAATPIPSFPTASSQHPLFFPGGSQATTPTNSLPQYDGWEPPAKRKYAEIVDSQEADSSSSDSRILDTLPDSRPVPFSLEKATPSKTGKRPKSIGIGGPSTVIPPGPIPPRVSSPSSARKSNVALPFGSPRKEAGLLKSPERVWDAPRTSVKDTREEIDDEGFSFENYDPFSDVEEIKDLKRRVVNVYTAEQVMNPGVPPRPPPIAQTEGQDMAFQLALAARIPIHSKRRPYLSGNARDFLAHMGRWDGFREYDGYLIHVDFTARETETLVYHVLEFSKISIERGETDFIYLARAVQKILHLGEHVLTACMQNARIYLIGRTTTDCVLFAKDCLDNRNHEMNFGEYLRVFLNKQSSLLQEPRQKLRLRRELGWGVDRTSIASEACRQLQHSVTHSLKPWKVFNRGSSDIMDIAWSPTGDKFSLATTTFSDVYNRPGNLILGCVSSSKARMLHGHQILRPEPLNGQDLIVHSTVCGVGFSPTGLLFSGGYDGSVKVWQAETAGAPLLSSRQLEDELRCLSVSPNHDNLVAAGTKQGSLELSSWSDDGNFLTAGKCILNKTTAGTLYPSCLAWGSRFYNHYLVAGYDATAEGSVSGSLVVYHAESGRQFLKVTPGSTGHFDVFSHPNGSFVAGCRARSHKYASAKSVVRIFHLTGTGAELEFDVDSEQLDINRVTLSPCGTYVTSSSTSGVTLVWDVRYPTKILHRLQHDLTIMPINNPDQPNLEREDTGVEFALWSPNHTSDYLYTGSSDGLVKIWSVKKGEPFVRNMAQVNAQIMSGMWSPSGDMLMVGDTSGTATLLSTRGKESGVDMFTIEGDILGQGGEASGESAEVPATELGRYYSRELIRSGQIIIGDGIMGHGAYGA